MTRSDGSTQAPPHESAPRFCTHCGSATGEGSFCRQCGMPVARSAFAPGATLAVAVGSRRRAWLTAAVAGLVTAGAAFAAASIVVGELNESRSGTAPASLAGPAVEQRLAAYDAPAPEGSTDDPRGAVQAAIRHHWELLRDGRYAVGYADLGPELQRQIGSRSEYVQRGKDRPLRDFDLSLARIQVRGRRADVVIKRLRTSSADGGCRDWRGSYGMLLSQGRWLIAETKLKYRDCGTPS